MHMSGLGIVSEIYVVIISYLIHPSQLHRDIKLTNIFIGELAFSPALFSRTYIVLLCLDGKGDCKGAQFLPVVVNAQRPKYT